MSERFDRQILVFGTQGQAKLGAAHVGIVGLGGIGSHIAQGLAFLGVGTLTLVDDDRVEETNLNRLIGGVPTDAKSHDLKVRVTERMIRSISPEAQIRVVPKNLRSREAIDALTECPVIFGCVDYDGARLVLMELAAAYEVTLIDSATEIIQSENQITEFGGRVVVARPGDFCLDCAHQIDMEVAKQELESLEIQELRKEHGYGLGHRGTAPSVVSLNGVLANLALNEFLAMTTNLREPKRHLVYYGMRGKVNAREDQQSPDCYTCGFLVGSRERANLYRYVLPNS
ncbi:MAG: ThiF family adenylyltransferase [Anaerolineae bacterium]|nr:ThiF family adenylyltransferase [Anaerolineae bacterium]